LSRFNKFVLKHASGWKVLLLFAVAVASFILMAAVLTPAFQDATAGLRPFDLNFGIGPEIVYRDLPLYSDRSRRIYLAFAFADYVYPATAAAFFSLFWAWMYKKAPNRQVASLINGGLLSFPFLFAIVDWLENAGFLFVIFTYPAEYPRVAAFAGALKGTKPFIELLILLLTIYLAVVTYRARRAKDETARPK
jgi:hypothetical protein